MKRHILLLAVLLLQASFVFAHLDNGEEIVKKGHIIDFGYSPKIPLDKGTTFLSFNLVNETTERPVEFDSAWIRISSSEEVVFSGTIRGSGGNVFIDYSFPYRGDYTAKAQFKDSLDNIIIEADFNIEVRHKSSGKEVFFITILILLALLLAKYKKTGFNRGKWKG